MSVQVPLFPWSLALLCKLQLKQPQRKDSLLNKVTNISFQYKQYTVHSTHSHSHSHPPLPARSTTTSYNLYIFSNFPISFSLSLSLSVSLSLFCLVLWLGASSLSLLFACNFPLNVVFWLLGPALTSKRVLNLWPCPHPLSLTLLAALYYAVQSHALFSRATSHSDQVTCYTFLALCCWPYSSRANWPRVIIP